MSDKQWRLIVLLVIVAAIGIIVVLWINSSQTATGNATNDHTTMTHPMGHTSVDAQLDRAMQQMHARMAQVQLTGQPDHDFLAEMIPHHQAAVDMARVELQHGQNPTVRALAQRIMQSQAAQVTEMQQLLQRA